MQYIDVTSQEVLDYNQLRDAFPNTYIPPAPTNEYLSALGVCKVIESHPPAYDQLTHHAHPVAPVSEGDQWVQAWQVVAMTEAEAANAVAAFGVDKTAMAAAIDDAVESKIVKSTRFAMGYQEREAAALAYKGAGYTGDPTVWVTRFADNVGMSHQAASDLILSQANGLRTALKELETLRMDKYLVLAQATPQEARAKHDEIIALISAVQIP